MSMSASLYFIALLSVAHSAPSVCPEPVPQACSPAQQLDSEPQEYQTVCVISQPMPTPQNLYYEPAAPRYVYPPPAEVYRDPYQEPYPPQPRYAPYYRPQRERSSCCENCCNGLPCNCGCGRNLIEETKEFLSSLLSCGRHNGQNIYKGEDGNCYARDRTGYYRVPCPYYPEEGEQAAPEPEPVSEPEPEVIPPVSQPVYSQPEPEVVQPEPEIVQPAPAPAPVAAPAPVYSEPEPVVVSPPSQPPRSPYSPPVQEQQPEYYPNVVPTVPNYAPVVQQQPAFQRVDHLGLYAPSFQPIQQPMQPIQPIQPMQPMQPMQPFMQPFMQPMQQPMQPMQPMQPVQPVQPIIEDPSEVEPLEPIIPEPIIPEPIVPVTASDPCDPCEPAEKSSKKPCCLCGKFGDCCCCDCINDCTNKCICKPCNCAKNILCCPFNKLKNKKGGSRRVYDRPSTVVPNVVPMEEPARREHAHGHGCCGCDCFKNILPHWRSDSPSPRYECCN